MTTVSFEAASIIDVIKRAEKAAPKVSESSERFAGIVLDVQPAGNYVVIRTTNEKVFYREVVDPVGISGERVEWRLSSSYLAKVVATFKSGSGMTIEFAQNGGLVEITQERKKARLGMMRMAGYPDWYESAIEGAVRIPDFGAALGLVEWAGDPSVPALNGIRLTGEAAYATNKYLMARYPLVIPGLETPITLESGLIGGMIDSRGDMLFKVLGGQVLLSPHERIQIRTATIGEKFPPVENAMKVEHPNWLRAPRDEIQKLIKTAMSVYPVDKSKEAIFRFFIGDGELAGIMEQADDPTTGIRDIIDVGGAAHEMHEIWFNPYFVSNALSNAPDEAVLFKYDTTNPRKPCVIEGNSGYQCWITPIDPSKRPGGTS